MPSARSRFLAFSFFVLLASCSAHAQVGNVTDVESTPIPGVGHDYIGILNETVSPSNGSLSIRIQVPMPTGRGLTIPLAFAYDSDGANPGIAPINQPPHNPALFQAGWSYSTPRMSSLSTTKKVTIAGEPVICPYFTAYVFYDPQGGRHALNVAWVNNPSTCNQLGIQNIPNGGDPVVSATLTPTTFVQDASGTTYTLGGTTLNATVEDRNGNIIKFVDNGNGAFAATDTAGRTVLSSNGFGATGNTLTVSGLSNPYNLTWGTTATWNYSAGLNLVFTPTSSTCNTIGYPTGQPSGSYTALSSLTLPNGESYTFTYDPTYGVVNQITYPTGGWVKYTWGVNSQSEIVFDAATDVTGKPNGFCAFRYNTPAVLKRQVSYDGTHIAEEQDFTYGTTWDSGTSYSDLTTWATKSASVRTYDEVRSPSMGLSYVTNYTYGSITIPIPPYETSGNLGTQVPVETQIVYNDFNGNLLKTVNKTWASQYSMASEQTVWPPVGSSGSLASQVNYSYGPLSVMTEKDEYNFGQTTTPTRKTIYNYQSFPANPLGAAIDDRPCQVLVEDGSNNHYAETDYFYDGSSSSTPCAAATSQALPGSGSYTGHDETHYGTTSTAPRGNATKITKLCFVGSQACTNSTTTATYDETGQILTSVNACGNGNNPCPDVTASSYTTTYSYTDNYDSPPSTSTNAYLTKITNPLGQSASFEYAYSDGQLIKATDINGLITQYAYSDPLRRLTSTTFPDGGQTTNSYNDAPTTPSVTTSKTINTSQTLVNTSVMDGLGHIAHTQLTSDPQGTVFTDTSYDGEGNVYTVSNPYRSCSSDLTSSCGTTTFVYDAIDRKTSATYPDNSVLNSAYCGPSTLVTDPTQRWRRSTVDGLDRLVEVDEPNSPTATVNPNGCPGTGDPIWVTSYTLDLLNNLTNVLQNTSHARSFTYDSLSRLLTSTNPEVGTITYTYDAASNLSTKKDARNITTTYGYEALNRETSASYSNSDPSISIAYDGTNCLGLSACQNIGHRTSMTDAGGSEIWAYQVDATNHQSLHKDQRTTSGITKTTSYVLDYAGNTTQATYPNGSTGRVVNYTFDSANRPSTATDGSNGITYASGPDTSPGATCLADVTCYTPQGTFYALAIGETSSFTGLNLTHIYNSRLQPQEFKASSTGGNAIDVTYSFQDSLNNNKNAGHVFSLTNNLDSTRSQNFSYDQLNRITGALTTSTYSTSPTHCWGETYSVDTWGNLNSIAATTNSAYTGCSQESGFLQTADGNNHLPSFGYDASGNTSSDGTCTYTWDGESQLKSACGVNYLYDGNGRRVAKTGSKLYWYGAGGEVLSETDSSGNIQNEYIFFGGKRIALVPASGNPSYYIEDLLGTSRVITTNAGVVCYDADFYPYGGERSYTNTCPQSYKFEGKERDTETGNDDFGARYYSNRYGRWLSADWSSVPIAVPYANLTNPQTLNLYSMVADDPESFADLDGHDGKDFLFGVLNAFFSDFSGAGRKDASGSDIRSGQALGDSLAVTVGATLAVGALAADITMDVQSGGTALLAGNGAGAVAQVAIVAVPAMGAVRGAQNLLKNSNKESSSSGSEKGGGRNEQKSNTERTQSAEKDLDSARKERAEVNKQKPSQARSERLRQLDKDIKHFQKKAAEKSETHSRKHKGQQQ